MPTIAYLANLFPSPTERYVIDEILELRRRGIHVISFSLRRPRTNNLDSDLQGWIPQTIYLRPLRLKLLLLAAYLLVKQPGRWQKLRRRIFFHGRESPGKRLRALAHTFLGAYAALVFKEIGVDHIHVHHGYFGSWVAMTAARFLGLNFSMTLHGSDILLHPAYLDLKLELCKLCVTISDFNRRHLVLNHPRVDPQKIVVQRLGVDCHKNSPPLQPSHAHFALVIFAAGRLHPVKNHDFLVRACSELRNRGLRFTCVIAGDGSDRLTLEKLIHQLRLQDHVRLLGRVPHSQMPRYYEMADLVVLTSRSEGIPLVLMEAMALGKIVLAPHITAIPELISHERTGFLYRPGSLEHFVDLVETINDNRRALDHVRQAARAHVLKHFNRGKNLTSLCNVLIANFADSTPDPHPDPEVFYENPVLQ